MTMDQEQQSFWPRIFGYPAHVRNWIRWKTGFCRRLRVREPVFIYQMGKVASQSVQKPLQKVYPGEVIHGHVFSPEYPQGEVKELYRYWEQRNRKLRMPIISLTREPVGRNVSAFFQNFERYTGVPVSEASHTSKQLLDIFMEVFPHHIPEIWFDESVKKNFGVDVFSVPFPHSLGTVVVEHPLNPLLVIRLETEDAVKEKAVRSFLNLRDFCLDRHNESEGKDYGALYHAFREEVRLPREYVEAQTSTRYFRHFYQESDRRVILKRWCD